MGTLLRGTAEAPSKAQAEAALEAAVSEIERWERLLSTWDPATPMSGANRGAVGAPTPVPEELVSVLAEAFGWSSRTGRAFDPTVGALVDAWDLRGAGRRPTDGQRTVALARSGPRTFSVSRPDGTVTRRVHGAWIDTGAFGKGAALRAAADTLCAHGVTRATIDLGGQVLVIGGEGDPLEVAVAHPARRDEPAVLLLMVDASVATSGTSERAVTVDGKRLGHILDPRTGLPVADRGSVSVVSADPFVADVLSTALFVMGPEAGLAWAEAREDVGVLFLVVDGEAVRTLHNQAMTRWLAQPPADTAGHPETSAPERRHP